VKSRAARRRRTNQALLLLVPIAVGTGLFSNTIGVDWWLDPATMHGVVALAIAVLTPWKAPIVQRGLGRTHRSRWTSVVLLGMIATTLATGLLHSTGFQNRLGPLTVMQVHIGGALVTLIMIIFHYRSHPVPLRSTDLDRRAFLGTIRVTAAAGAVWALWEGGLGAVGASGSSRRFTGSHERGSFSPAAMPVTSWLDDRPPSIDGSTWSVAVNARPVTLDQLASAPRDTFAAVLDCTSAWYSEQDWTGVRLDRLLAPGDARSVLVRSRTGYSRRFPIADLDRLWLVTELGGKPLSPGHGFPARMVAPGRRGFWWVKWVATIEASRVPWWWQLPFPVT